MNIKTFKDGSRVVVVFEGLDAPSETEIIKSFIESLVGKSVKFPAAEPYGHFGSVDFGLEASLVEAVLYFTEDVELEALVVLCQNQNTATLDYLKEGFDGHVDGLATSTASHDSCDLLLGIQGGTLMLH